MNTKRKILHITPNGLGNAGVPAVILSIVSNLHNEFLFGCTVYTKRLNKENEFTTLGGKLHRINIFDHSSRLKHIYDQLFRGVILMRNIYNICKEEKYDVVHCHMGWEAAFCLCGAWLAGVKCRIAHAHNPKINHKNIIKSIVFNTLHFATNCLSTIKIGCSEQTCITFFKNDYRVIYNSIDISKFTYKEKRSKNNVKFIHVGRFDYQKNQEFILDVFSKLIKIKPDISLDLVGFGYNENLIRRIISQFNLEKQVTIIDGTKADISSIFHHADYMIFPSRYEGFGIVLLEAQASGVYCFVSDAVQRITDAGLWEQISLDESADEWAQKILKRINENNNVSQECVMSKLAQFDINYIAKQYAIIYNEN